MNSEKPEDRFYRLLSEYSKLQDALLVGIMPASPAVDKSRVDFYVIWKDDSTIPIDVKSSYAGKKKRLSKAQRESTCLIFMREDLDDERMLCQILEVLKKWRAQRLL